MEKDFQEKRNASRQMENGHKMADRRRELCGQFNRICTNFYRILDSKLITKTAKRITNNK